jgi:hypothetical protein
MFLREEVGFIAVAHCSVISKKLLLPFGVAELDAHSIQEPFFSIALILGLFADVRPTPVLTASRPNEAIRFFQNRHRAAMRLQ